MLWDQGSWCTFRGPQGAKLPKYPYCSLFLRTTMGIAGEVHHHAGLVIIDRQKDQGIHSAEHLLPTNMSGQKKKFLRFPSKSSILDSLRSWSPSSRSPSRVPSLQTSRPPSRTGHNTHIQSVNPLVSAAQAGSSYQGMNSIRSLHQRFNFRILVAKDYVKITLNGTYELLKIAKASSGMLAPLSSALGGVIACVDLYKASCVVSLTSTMPYSIHRERLAITKRWNGS